MKFIKLDPDDHELFRTEAKGDFPLDYLIQHFKKFQSMYMGQGTTFWVRYLLAHREFYLGYVFEDMMETLMPNNRTCYYYCVKAIENTFIRIHKTFIEKRFEGAKQLIKSIVLLIQLEFDENGILRDLSSLMWKSELINKLVGTLRTYDKSQSFKVRIVCFFYYQFYYNLCNLLTYYMKAKDLPEDYEDAEECFSIDLHYFDPFEDWFSPDFVPQKFDRYIAKVYGSSLSNMLMLANADEIFSKESRNHICYMFEEDEDEDLEYLTNSKLKHKKCDVHNSCKKIILHDKECEDPHFCSARNSCKMICDTISKERLSKLGNNNNGFWKICEASHFSSTKPDHMDASTQVESSDSLVQTYVLDGMKDSRPPSPPWYLSPEMKNTYYQYKRKEETAARLREKLEKKQIAEAKQQNLKNFGNLNSSLFQDSAYCIKLYKKAVKVFKRELNCDSTSQNHTDMSHLPSKKIMKLVGAKHEVVVSAPLEESGKKSIGVGYEGVLCSKVLRTSTHECEEECYKSHLHLTTNEAVFAKELIKVIEKADNNHVQSSEKVEDEVSQSETLNKTGNQANINGESTPNKEPKLQKSTLQSEGGTGSNIKKDLMNGEMKNVGSLADQSSKVNTEVMDTVDDFTRQNSNSAVEEFMSLIQTGKPGNSLPSRTAEENHVDKTKAVKSRHVCACCGKLEEGKKFKKCSRCKAENFPEQRYYCSQNCQLEDWKERHREEHLRFNADG